MQYHPVLERSGRFLEAKPIISDDVYIAPNATILGRVSIHSGSSVWFHSVIRADINEIRTLITKVTRIPAGSLVLGSPGEVVRKVTTGEQKGIEELAEKYVAVAKHYCRLE